jgi:hypothetical protein
MLWLVCRQHSIALFVLVAFSAIAIGALIVSEGALTHILAQAPYGSWWREMGWTFYSPQYPDLAMQAIPLIAAMFVGVQLIARDLEDGTAAFAWTQGYGKARWVLAKLAAAAAVLVPMAVGLGLIFGWWHRLYVPATGYFTLHAFALYAPALAGWTIAGLTLGMAAAALTGREARAMWVTLASWIVLHHFAIVGSPRTPPGDFWRLQFAQLGILLGVSGLLTAGTIAAIQGAPAIPGMPRLLRAVPRRAGADVQVLARQLGRRRSMAATRAAWRQHRTGLLVALCVLAIYAATLVITGMKIHAEPPRLRPQYATLTGVNALVGPADASYLQALLLPFLIGAFVGGSLTGPDLDRGIVGFAWAQGVSRARWAAGQLVAAGAVLVTAAVAAGLVFQWWVEPYDAQRLADPWFALYAPVYAGWMAVALTGAPCLGVLTRSRTAAAILCLIGTLVAAGGNAWLRAHYLPTAVAINRPAPPGSLVVNLNEVHGTRFLIYEPASQFWQLQAIESAGLFALALLFGASAVWLVRRKEA